MLSWCVWGREDSQWSSRARHEAEARSDLTKEPPQGDPHCTIPLPRIASPAGTTTSPPLCPHLNHSSCGHSCSACRTKAGLWQGLLPQPSATTANSDHGLLRARQRAWEHLQNHFPCVCSTAGAFSPSLLYMAEKELTLAPA